MVRILAIGDLHGKLPGGLPRDVELILLTGDIGKADLARKMSIENVKRRKEGLPEKEYTSIESKKSYMEIYNSTIKILKKFSKIAPTYSIQGNVGLSMIKDSWVKEEIKRIGLKLPSFRKGLNRIGNFNLIKNRIRNFKNIRIGFLEYFVGSSWIKEFNETDKKRIRKARRNSKKVRKILKWFDKLDILVCHQPPYGILDKVSAKYNPPKSWIGKHAGSKVILDYVKKYQPTYVVCGHIHEGKGEKMVGKSNVINLGMCGWKVLEL